MDTDVIIIGGGATGMGVAWDLSQRGLGVTLVEMGGLATGTTGRYHGLLHSGARYVTSDLESARECIQENRIIRRLAPLAIEDNGGLFVLPPGDDEDFVERWTAGCAAAGIPIQEISPQEALQREPALHPGIRRVFEVPDATCDSFALVAVLRRNADANNASFLTNHRVESFVRQGNVIQGARLKNLLTGETSELRSRMVVIAAGPWSQQVAALAGVHFQMSLSRGAMIGFGRWTHSIINRLRPPGDGDIFVPQGNLGVAGTTSIPTDDPADARIEPDEVERVIEQSAAFLPVLREASILRMWAGVRPLYDPGIKKGQVSGGHVDGRAATRTFVVLDHNTPQENEMEQNEEGVEGLVTITGGKLTTFRLMAEKTADLVCQKLDSTARPCQTATTEVQA